MNSNEVDRATFREKVGERISKNKMGAVLIGLLGCFIVVGMIWAIRTELKSRSEDAAVQAKFAEQQAADQAMESTKVQAQNQKYEAEQTAKTTSDQVSWDASPAGKLCKSHPGWTHDDCVGVIDNKIWIGMSYDMAIYERGNPTYKNEANYGSGDEYQLCWDSYVPSCLYDTNADWIVDSYN